MGIIINKTSKRHTVVSVRVISAITHQTQMRCLASRPRLTQLWGSSTYSPLTDFLVVSNGCGFCGDSNVAISHWQAQSGTTVQPVIISCTVQNDRWLLMWLHGCLYRSISYKSHYFYPGITVFLTYLSYFGKQFLSHWLIHYSLQNVSAVTEFLVILCNENSAYFCDIICTNIKSYGNWFC